MVHKLCYSKKNKNKKTKTKNKTKNNEIPLFFPRVFLSGENQLASSKQ